MHAFPLTLSLSNSSALEAPDHDHLLPTVYATSHPVCLCYFSPCLSMLLLTLSVYATSHPVCLCYFSPCLGFGINSRVGLHYLWIGIQPQDLRLPNEYTLGHCGLSAATRHKLAFTSRHYSLLIATWHGSTLLNPYPFFLERIVDEMPYECLHMPTISAFLSQTNRAYSTLTRQLKAVIIEVSIL